MFAKMIPAALLSILIPAAAMSATLTETFNAGISPSLWQITNEGGMWTIAAPDAQGRLQISKPADPNGPNQYVAGAVRSRFQLVGDFTVTVDFSLLAFPGAGQGYNESLLQVIPAGGGNFSILRFNLGSDGMAEGYSTQPVGQIDDSSMTGRYGITRQGNTISALYDHGGGFITLGTETNPAFLGPAYVTLTASQVVRDGSGLRSFSALDVRYDNLNIVATDIIPEPATLSLLALGGLALLRRRKATTRRLLTVHRALRRGSPIFLTMLGLGLLAAPAMAEPLIALSWAEKNLYRIDSGNLGAPSLIGTVSVGTNLNELVTAPLGRLYTLDRDANTIITVSATDASVLSVVPLDRDVVVGPRGFDLAPSGVLYGVFANMDLCTISPLTGQTIFVGRIAGDNIALVEAIAFSPNGTLYAAGSTGGDANTLYVINPNNAAASYIGVTGLSDIDCLTFGRDGYLYGADSQAGVSANLYRFDPTNGNTTNFGNTGVVELNGITSIPEPATLSLLALGALAILRRKNQAGSMTTRSNGSGLVTGRD